MKYSPALAEYRCNANAKVHLSAHMSKVDSEWRAIRQVAQVLGDLESFAAGAPLVECAALARLLSSDGGARMFVDEWVDAYCGALASSPLGQLPLRYQTNANASVIVMARSGEAELSLVGYFASRKSGREDPVSGYFAPQERHEVVLSGSGRVIVANRKAKVTAVDSFTFRSREMGVGSTLSQFGALETKFYGRIDGRLVLLRLTRPSAEGGPTREYRFADGALLHQASSDKHESCKEMMIALLGKMKRSDAAPAMTRVAGHGFSDHLRWEAMRQCLSLDTARGFEVLCTMARSTNDPLAAGAQALRAQLMETHPQLSELERMPCPS